MYLHFYIILGEITITNKFYISHRRKSTIVWNYGTMFSIIIIIPNVNFVPRLSDFYRFLIAKNESVNYSITSGF